MNKNESRLAAAKTLVAMRVSEKKGHATSQKKVTVGYRRMNKDTNNCVHLFSFLFCSVTFWIFIRYFVAKILYSCELYAYVTDNLLFI